MFESVEKTPYISRRDFLKLTSTGLVVTVGAVLGVNKYLESLNKPRSESVPNLDIFDEIYSRYGVYVPRSAGEYTKYQVCVGEGDSLVHCGEEQSTQVTSNEAETIKNALGKIPSVGKLAQLVIPFRNTSPGAIAGGNFWGPNWGYFLDPSKYDKYPRDKYLSKISAINLVLSDKQGDDLLPLIDQNTNFLPLLSSASMTEVGIQPKYEIYYPWTNHRERLLQTTVHEIGGHGVTELAGRIKFNYGPEAEYQASAISMFGGIPLDTYHPIISSFAEVNGWRLTPYADFMAQWGDFGRQRSEEFKKTEPSFASWPVWDRDPEYWGSLRDRKIRLDPYASYGTIRETFATFFMFYSLGKTDNRYDQSLLTVEEKQYFEEMFDGLTKNPERYIKKLMAENPGPSFNLDLFKTETGPQASGLKTWLKYT